MNRKGFIATILGALGVGGSLGLHSRQSAVPDVPAPSPPVTSGYLHVDPYDPVTVTTTTATTAVTGTMTWIEMP